MELMANVIRELKRHYKDYNVEDTYSLQWKWELHTVKAKNKQRYKLFYDQIKLFEFIP